MSGLDRRVFSDAMSSLDLFDQAVPKSTSTESLSSAVMELDIPLFDVLENPFLFYDIDARNRGRAGDCISGICPTLWLW